MFSRIRFRCDTFIGMNEHGITRTEINRTMGHAAGCVCDVCGEYTDDMILEAYIVCGNVEDVAMDMVDHAAARGEYEGCSSTMEVAYSEYTARIRRVIDAAGS